MNKNILYKIGYASRTDSFNCRKCKKSIYDGELQIGERVQSPPHDKNNLAWSHKDCVLMAVLINSSGDIEGFEDLKDVDQLEMLFRLGEIGDISTQFKITPETTLEAKIAAQNVRLLQIREHLEKACSKEELNEFLTLNNCGIIEGRDNILDRCADFLTFGAIYKCKICSKGDMIFTKAGYICNATNNNTGKCGFFGTRPMRFKCAISETLRQKRFFANLRQTVENRIVKPSVSDDRAQHSTIDNRNPRPSSSKNAVTSKIRNDVRVDPKSNLDRFAHVYCYRQVSYSKTVNSLFKIQVLESNDTKNGKHDYWLFENDDEKSIITPQLSAELACFEYEKRLKQRPGNNRNTKDELKPNTSVTSKLSPKVGDLIKFMFDVDSSEPLVDGYYKQLQTDIHQIDSESKGYKLIKAYVERPLPDEFKLKVEVLEAFRIDRHGEKNRYHGYGFRNYENRMLLWHESRLTNFAKILSDGLKMHCNLPKNMFGRGIYFSDVVSNSAQHRSQTGSIALVALCEVALGKIYEASKPLDIYQPPYGYDSVKGVGKYQPDEKTRCSYIRKDGVIIPFRSLVKTGNFLKNMITKEDSRFKLNEFVVYNEAQVNIQYLVKVRFIKK